MNEKGLPSYGVRWNLLFRPMWLALLVFLLSGLAVQAQTATVTSDKDDYAPRSNAVFTGAGFAPNENVTLKVKNLNRPCNTVSADSSYLPWTVKADASGGFVTNWTVCDCNGDSLRLRATGQTSGRIAYAYFTDAAVFTATISPTNSGVSATNVQYTITIINNNTEGTNTSIGSVIVKLPVNYSNASMGTITGFPRSDKPWSGFYDAAFGVFKLTTSGGGEIGPNQNLIFNLIVNNPPSPGTYEWTVNATDKKSDYNIPGTFNISGSQPSVTIGTNKSDQSITFNTLSDKTYGDASFTLNATATSGLAVTYSVLSGPATISGNTITITGAGNVTIRASQGGNASYYAAPDIDRTFTVSPKSLSATITISNKTYDGTTSALIATRSLSGIIGSDNVSLGNSGTASFSDATAGTGKAVTVSSLALSGTAANNYVLASTSATAIADITKATATITLAGLTGQLYDGSAKPVTASTTPAGLSGVFITYSGNAAAPVNAGPYAVVGSLTNPNYQAINATGTLVIGKAAATLTLANLNHVYDGAAKYATASTIPSGLTGVNISNNGQIDANTYSVQATLFNDNYEAVPVSGNLIIEKADQVISWADPAAIIYGTSLSSTQLNAAGAQGGLTYNPAAGTLLDAGDHTLTVNAAETTNFKPAAKTVSISVQKATPTLAVVVGGPYSYDNTVRQVTSATVSGVGGASLGNATVVYKQAGNSVSPKDAGSYEVVASFAGTNNYHAVSDNSHALIINKASSVTAISLAAGPFIYTGSGIEPATVTVTGAGGLTLNSDATYSNNINVGTATASYSYGGDANHEASSASEHFYIDKAASVTTVTIIGNSFTFTGAAIEPATVSVTGAGGLDLSPAATYANNVNAGIASASFIFEGDSNHEGSSGTQNFTIGKAEATLVINDLNQTYSGSSLPVSVVTTPAGLSVDVTYNGVSVVPQNAASYAVSAEINDLNYAGSATGTLIIAKATPVITWADPASLTYGTALSVTQLNAGTNVAGAFSYTPDFGTYLNAGTAQNLSVTFVPADAENYTSPSKTVPVNVEKAQATIAVNGYSGIYDAVAHGATGSATGARGENLTNLLDLGNSFTSVPGGTATWTFAGDANHHYSTGSVAIDLGAKTIAISADAQTKTYGNNDPELSYHITAGSLAGADVFSGSLQRAAGQNVGNYAIGQGTLALNNNYSLSYAGANLTITERPVTITADGKSKIYGENDPALTYQITSGNLVGTDNFTGSLSRVSGEDVGTYAISSSLANSNYSVTYVPANLTIIPKSITAAISAENKVYDGDNAAAVTGSATGVNGAAVAVTISNAVFEDANAGIGKVVTANVAISDQNYSLTAASAAATANISARPITVSANQNQSKVYGSPDPVYTYTSSESLIAGNSFSGKLDRVTGETVAGGPYAFTLGTLAAGANYSLTLTGTNTFAITAKPITASIAASDKVYDGYAAATVTGSVPQTDLISGDLVPVTVSNANFNNKVVGANKTVTADVAISNTNYSLTAATAATNASIFAKDITGTFASANKIYDGNTNAAAANRQLLGIVGADLVNLTGGSAAFENAMVGTGKTVSLAGATLTGADAVNYNLASVATTIADITAKELTATVMVADKVYDATNAASITGRFLNGILNADDVSLGTSGTATFTDAEAGPNKTVTISGLALSGAAAGNYALAAPTVYATATIHKADAVIEIFAFSGTYDGDVHTASGTATGVGGADLSNGLSFTSNFHSVPGGVTNWTFAGGTNYNNTNGTAAVTIAARPVTISADAKTKNYGNPDPDLTAQVTSGSIVTGDAATGALTRVTGENVGNYAIDKGSYSFGSNYAETFLGADLTIGTRAIIITAVAAGKTYGNADPVLTAQATNVVNGDVPAGSLTRASGENVGAYAIGKGTYTYGANYSETFVSANLTISSRPITVSADAGQSKIYGNSDPVFTYSASEPLLAGNSFTGGLGRQTGTNAGTYAYTLGNLSAGSNYSLSLTGSNTFQVMPRAVTIKANNQTKTYGDALNLGTAAFTIDALTPMVTGEAIASVTLNSAGAAAMAEVNTYPVGASAAVAGSNTSLSNYTVTYSAGTLTVNQAPLGILVHNQSRQYGVDNPELTGAISGIKNNDEITPNYSTPADITSSTGTYLITASPSGSRLGNYAVTVNNGTLTIGKATLTVTANPKTVQYSDVVTFDATITGFNNGETLANSDVSGSPAFTTGPASTGAQIVNGKVLSPAGSYSIFPCPGTLTSANYSFAFVNGTLTVTKEDAEVVYTGLEYFSTLSPSSSTASIELMATLKDHDDGSRGDIQNAKVDFKTDFAVIGQQGVIGNQTVSLISAQDNTLGMSRTGLVSVNLSGSQVNAGGTTFEVKAEVNATIVGQYYTGSTGNVVAPSQTIATTQAGSNGVKETTLITIAVPGQDYVNGGGHLVATNSFGKYAASVNSKVNFGFTMKWNKSGKNVQGQMNVIFRKDGRTYKIKSNAINTLGTSTLPNIGRRADFNTKANFTDVTNEANPISLEGGNLDLTVQVLESTNPGTPNEISITLRNGSEVLFSSHWVNNTATRKALGNGSIKVLNSSIPTARMASPAPAPASAQPVAAQFDSYPNPFNQLANIRFALEADQQFELAIYDLRGSLIRKVASGKAEAGKVYEFKLDGQQLPHGMYFARLITENGVQTLKVMKE